MSAKVKLELSCRRCTAVVLCDLSDDEYDNRDPSAVSAGSPKRPPNWSHVRQIFEAFSRTEYGDLCPVCIADFMRFMRGSVVDIAGRIDNARGDAP
jgi:hypothetical protein